MAAKPQKQNRFRLFSRISDQIMSFLRADPEKTTPEYIPQPADRSAAAPARQSGNPDAEDRDYVLWAYRLLLGREPERPDLVEAHPLAKDHRRLVESFLNSQEFRDRNTNFIGPPYEDAHSYFLTELDGGLRFWVNLRDQHVSRGIIAGIWETTETNFVLQYVKPDMTAVDIGANLGWFTVHMSRLVGPTGRVISFEPRADIFGYLGKTVTENQLQNVRLHNCALGPFDGETSVFWAMADDNPGGTHMVPPSANHDTMTNGYRVQKILMKPLDKMVDVPVDFIKIDVEGAEKLVFDGASRILSTDRPLIMSEMAPTSLLEISAISAEDYIAYFAQRGYIARYIEPNGTCGPRIDVGALGSMGPLINIALIPSERDRPT